jgi:NitT/TauT family transport system permease protein
MTRREFALSLCLCVLLLAAWQWGLLALAVPSYIFPNLSAVVAEFVRMVAYDRVLHHLAVTAVTVLLGFAIGAAIGMIAGYVLGVSRTAEVVLSPYILGMQIAPKVAFAPLFIMWFGYNLYPKLVVAVLIVFFPVMINVMGAVRNVDRDMFNLVRSFTATRMQVFWKIEFPASLPALFSGLRIAATLAVIGVSVGEMVGGSDGLGYLLIYGQGQADTAMVFVAIILLTLVGIVAYLCVVLVEGWVLSWMPRRAAA